MFDRSGRVVPIESLSFTYKGKRNRITGRTKAILRGTASTNATHIQWKSNHRKWRTITVSTNDTWRARIRNLQMGSNRLRLRALAADGEKTSIKRITISRTARVLAQFPGAPGSKPHFSGMGRGGQGA